jgi:hypothetical protein
MERKVKNVPGAGRRYDTVSGSGEPDMNRFSSHPDHKNGHDSPGETIIQDEKVIAFSY